MHATLDYFEKKRNDSTNVFLLSRAEAEAWQKSPIYVVQVEEE